MGCVGHVLTAPRLYSVRPRRGAVRHACVQCSALHAMPYTADVWLKHSAWNAAAKVTGGQNSAQPRLLASLLELRERSLAALAGIGTGCDIPTNLQVISRTILSDCMASIASGITSSTNCERELELENSMQRLHSKRR